MTILRALLALGGLLLAASIVWAGMQSNLLEGFGRVTAEPWGVVTIIDLYLGFILAAVVIALVERPVAAAAWIVPVFFLGNIVTALWLVLKLPSLVERLRSTR